MHFGNGTYIPADGVSNGMSRSVESQESLDRDMSEFILWKRENELPEYESAFAKFQAQGGEIDDLDMFILAFPDLSKAWFL